MKNEDKVRTTEFYLSVALLALKEELILIEKEDNSKRAIFVFKSSPTLGRNIEQFRNGKLLIEPQALFMQHKMLKSRLYASL